MKKGFTLAEVLITLSIIGIISALTIPGLKSGSTASKADAWHAKYCQILDEAIRQAMYDKDYSSVSSVTESDLYDNLQSKKNDVDGKYYMKDGTMVDASNIQTQNKTFIVAIFPSKAKLSGTNVKRYYVVDTAYQGIDCVNNGQINSP